MSEDIFKITDEAGAVRTYSDEDHVDTEGASPIVKLSVSTLHKKRCSGDGPPFIKVGRRVVYKVGSLRKWMADREFTSTSEVTASKAKAEANRAPTAA